MSKGVVLWNAKEAKEHCEQFTKDYAALRNNLLDHLDHKGHVALKYSDDWDGFFAYCKEKLKLELAPATIRLQISTAQVSREVGVDVPMVISRQLAKLPPEKQKGVYDEVIGAREVAGQRSANQMEPDVRRVVRREMGVVDPAPFPITNNPPVPVTYDVNGHPRPPSVVTDTVKEWNPRNDTETADTVFGMPKSAPAVVIGVDTGQEGESLFVENHKVAEGPSPFSYSIAYEQARALLRRFVAAYASANQDAMVELYAETIPFLEVN